MEDIATGNWKEHNWAVVTPKKPGNDPGYEVGYGKPPKHTQFGQPGANPHGNGRPKGASLRAAVARELARNPDADGIGEAVSAIAREVVRRLRSKKGFDAHLYGRVAEQIDGKPAQSIEHTGEIRLVPVILSEMPADMLEEGEAEE